MKASEVEEQSPSPPTNRINVRSGIWASRPEQPAPLQAPYPGLRPFTRNETHLFFGRDDCVEAMVVRLAKTRFLAVLGSSGSGKSSLVNAGLVPALEMGQLSDAGSDWEIVHFRPGGSPFLNLASKLLATMGGSEAGNPEGTEIKALQNRLARGGPRVLIEWCREGRPHEGKNLLLLVDQFEELFRYQTDAGREEVDAFVALLLESRCPIEFDDPRDAEIPIFVAITMRSEYLGACSLIEGLAEIINEGTFLTPRMTRKECEQAIVGPARVCGIEIEDRLVARLLNDLSNFASFEDDPEKEKSIRTGQSINQLNQLARRADQLPLMQHALNRMWYGAKETIGLSKNMTLLAKDYRGLEQELDEHARSIVDGLDPQKRSLVETIFRALTEGSSVFDAVRRPVSYAELVALCAGRRDDVADIVKAFAAPGVHFLFVMPEPKGRLTDGTRIDISHESLIRQWKQLSTWLEAEARDGREWKKLVEDARDNAVLTRRKLRDASALLADAKKNRAWTDRYGNSFDEVQRLVRKNQARRWRGWATAAAVLAIIVLPYGALVTFYNLSFTNYRLAIKSSQKLLNEIGDSFNEGSVTTRGAKKLLRTAESIIDQVTAPALMLELGGLKIKMPGLAAQPLDLAELKIDTILMQYDLLYTIGDYDAGYKMGQAAREILKGLRNSEQDDPRGLLLAYSISWRMGDALADQGKDPETLERGLQEFGYAETLARNLAEMDPQDGGRQRNIMFVLQKVGDIRQVQQDSEAALAKYNEALEIAKKLVARPSPNPMWRRDLANCYSRLGQGFSQKQDFVNALQNYNTALEIRTELFNANKEDAVAQFNLGRSHVEIGKVYEQQGKLDAALAEYRITEGIRSTLVKKDPSNDARLNQLAIVQMYIGEVLQSAGEQSQNEDDRRQDWEAALEQFNKALSIRQDLTVGDPENQNWQGALAVTRLALGGLLDLEKRTDEALQQYSYAAESLDDLTDNRPKRAAEYRGKAFKARMRMGAIEDAKGKTTEALEDYRKALTIAQQLASQNEKDVSWQRNLASVHEKIGDEFVKKDDPSGGVDQYQAALGIIKKLSEGSSDSELIQLAEALQAKIAALGPK